MTPWNGIVCMAQLISIRQHLYIVLKLEKCKCPIDNGWHKELVRMQIMPDICILFDSGTDLI